MSLIDIVASVLLALLFNATKDSSYLTIIFLWFIWSELMEIRRAVKKRGGKHE